MSRCTHLKLLEKLTMTNEQELQETTLETPELSQPFQETSGEGEIESPEARESTPVEGDSQAVEAEIAEEQAPQEELTPEQIIASLTQEIASLTEKLGQENQQFETLKKRYIAQAAEFDNFRKRTEKEKKELETQVKCRTIKELLPVVDNFERARNQIEPADEGEAVIHKSYQGVYKNLVDSLKRLGVSPMRPEGEPFDPLYHEAMLREPTNDYPEGTVLEQLIRGYLLGDQVLRHAMVKVAAPQEPSVTPEESPAQAEANA
ncbi:GrpE protein [Rippkaea orientalis PCC 8801]|uniref:Protein GrpE n=1 Tax=Rippkaea orientalis (strain PCC 8801 / RF-1) TaxID=41431 RepID=B7JVL2_RIPO1|nr:nucleotide exchange factor GrpE [Rippkaea orientalis]ACK64583.1 GrpE protein [Rippkaea orientalis PCC 8801]